MGGQTSAKMQLDKITMAKKCFMTILDVLNARYAPELKKDSEKLI